MTHIVPPPGRPLMVPLREALGKFWQRWRTVLTRMLVWKLAGGWYWESLSEEARSSHRGHRSVWKLKWTGLWEVQESLHGETCTEMDYWANENACMDLANGGYWECLQGVPFLSSPIGGHKLVQLSSIYTNGGGHSDPISQSLVCMCTNRL